MPHFLMQAAYTSQAWDALVKNPADRFDAVRKPIEKLGGKILTSWFAFGDHDIVTITEFPDNVSAAAISIAFAAGGSLKSVKTTPLMSTAEGMEALKKAAACGYKPHLAAKAAGR